MSSLRLSARLLIIALVASFALTVGAGALPSHGVGACGNYTLWKTTTNAYYFYDPLLGYNVQIGQGIAAYHDPCRNWEVEMFMWGPSQGTGQHQGVYYPHLYTYPSGDPGNCSGGYTGVSAYWSTVVWQWHVDDDNFCGFAAYGVGWFYSYDTGIWYTYQVTW